MTVTYCAVPHANADFDHRPGLWCVGLRKSAGQDDDPKPLPAEVVKAWKDAGATVGWMKVESNGLLTFFEKPEQGATPAFRFAKWKDGVLPKLPYPDTPFGLDRAKTKGSDTGLKELGNLKGLTVLALCETQVTNEAVEELRKLLPKCFVFHC